ncbi:MAG: LamG domain-containing protein [Saprospiraceae bacterium]
MKMHFILLLMLILSSASFAQLPGAGLVAHYNFNRELNKDSTRVYDMSGNRNHGSMLGYLSYTPDRYGVPCSALYFDGSSYVTIPSSKSLKRPQDGLTIAVWFKLAQGADFFKQWITICCKSDHPDETLESPQYRMQATAQTVSINTAFTKRVIPQLKYEVWYFYAYTYDGNKVSVYLDGRYVFEHDYSNPLLPNDMPLEIGRDLPGALEYYYGAMDDLRIYDRALSESELTQLYQDKSEANDPDRCPQPPSQVASISLPPAVQVVPPSTLPDTTPSNPALPLPTTPIVLSSPPADSFAGLPEKILNIPIKYQKTVEVQSQEVTIYPYDNEKEDGDVISVNVNGVWVLDHFEIKNKKPNPSRSSLIKCSLNPGTYNYFISRAWNVGSIPPNTLTVEIDDGVTVQKVLINSDVGLSGGIRIVCKQ